ncbi:MAG: regulatory iron-sulfur-containing complex subunit RicT [Acidobacteriota bacterium]|nr:regulatory iron-sulfur-containing complex subunit RicT [Acidobacteriota bacterium]
MLEIVTVRFEANKSTANFLAHDVPLRVGDRCIVTTKRGVELGLVIDGRRAENLGRGRSKVNKALRKATERDLYLHEKKKDQEARALQLCKKMIKAHKLSMKLSKAEYVFDGSRVIFYFTATKRVDFRNLVKLLARRLRARIEMRQVGARDEAKLVGGMGCCGTGENCSAKFLKDLKSVSIRAAKDQGLTVNPGRLSGMCGRLKCCLNFEADGARSCNN